MSRRPGEIFLSHSSSDQQAAERIAECLRERYGLKVWFSPSHIRGADAWHDEIGKALGRCDWFVVLVTPAAIRSVWVKRELVFALSERRYADRIVPVKMKACDPFQLSWTLKTIQLVTAMGWKPAEIATALAAIWKVPAVDPFARKPRRSAKKFRE